MKLYELTARYDTRASFYGKAHVQIFSNGKQVLLSYGTPVAEITAKGIAKVYGKWSQTTSRHQKEFLRQNGFSVCGKTTLESYMN